MTVTYSAEVMRAMGFRPFEVGESLTASFSSISVYEARGIALGAGVTEVATGKVAGVHYRIAIGANLNDTCIALTNDLYVDGESDWKKEHRCSGPFVLVQLGPTRARTITEGHIRTETDGSTTTFDSFPRLKGDLEAFEAAALPPLLTSLTCFLGDPARNLELRKIDRANTGWSDGGRIVRDFRVRTSGDVVVSQGLPPNELAAELQAATDLAPQLNTKAARFFALGLGEDDELKKFLYFFLALEVQTHAAYARIDHACALKSLLDPALLHRASAVALLRRQADQLRNLFDRFVWCAACAWPGIEDADVEQFRRLKAARDDIAHGTTSGPPQGYAQEARGLAKKLLKRGQP